MTPPRIVDCRGLGCPQPVLRTRQALLESPAPLEVIVDNEGSSLNVQRFAESQGARVEVAQRDGLFHLSIAPGQTAPAAVEPPIVCPTAPARDLVVLVTSEVLGQGDDALGAILMAAFLDTLAQFKGELSHLVLVNGGARLAVEGSPVLEQLRQLEETGAQVLVCGTCLNHFAIKDKLRVGSVSNMYAIIETLTRARRIVRP